jgi:hypothetical protein
MPMQRAHQPPTRERSKALASIDHGKPSWKAHVA